MGKRSVRTRPKSTAVHASVSKQNRQTKRSPKGRWAIVGATLVSALLLILVVFVVPALSHADSKVAVINGSEVTDQELSFYMRQLRPQIQNEWKQKHGQTLQAQDWNTEQDGQSPLQLLQQRALNAIKQDKALLWTAQQQGLIKGIRYADLIDDMKQENERRTQAIANGQIVYGLSSFTPESYYSHVLASLRTELKKHLGQQPGNPLYVSDDAVKQYLRDHTEEWTAGVSQYELTRWKVPTDQQHKATVQASLYADIQRWSMEQLQRKYQLASPDKVTISPEGSIAPTSYNNELLNELQRATDPTHPIMLETSQGFELYRLDHTSVDEQEALQKYRVQIAATLQDQLLDRYIQQQQQQLTVTLYPDRLHAVMASFI